MLLRPVLALTLFGALGHAVPAAAAPATAPDGREIRTLLTRIHDAASKQNFQGTFVVSAGGAIIARASNARATSAFFSR